MKKLFFGLFVMLCIASCSTVNKTSTTRSITAPVIAATIADLDVAQQKISYTYYPTSAVKRGGLANVKAAAVAEALAKNGNGDVLVESQCEVVTYTGFFRRTIKSVTVTGYPATYKNFKAVSAPTLEKMLLNGAGNK